MEDSDFDSADSDEVVSSEMTDNEEDSSSPYEESVVTHNTCLSDSLCSDEIDKNRIIKAIEILNNQTPICSSKFVWGNAIDGLEGLVKTLCVQDIGDIPIPVSTKVVIILFMMVFVFFIQFI